MIAPQRRRQLDFYLLSGMIGLWVYWLFLYRTGLLDISSLKFYLWLLWRNSLPVLLFSLIFVVAFWCLRKKRLGLGITIIFLAVVIGCWEYAPDFPKAPPLYPPKIFWQSTSHGIPVALAVSYAYSDEMPPLFFIKLQNWLYRKKVRVVEGDIMKFVDQVKEVLMKLAEKAEEDVHMFEKCLNIAFCYLNDNSQKVVIPLFAEKRYEHVTGQLCWVLGFVSLQQESDGVTSFWTFPSPFSVSWVAVRFRFPQKAWLTYLAIEPEHALRNLFLILVIVAGYGIFLKLLRYAFDRWL